MDIDGVLNETFSIYGRFFARLVLLAGAVFVVLGLLTAALDQLSTGGPGGFVLGLAGALVSLVGGFWLQGVLVEATVDLRDGRADLAIPELFARAQPHLPTIIIAGLLAGLGIVAGLVLFIVPGLYLLTIWAVVIPVIVLEKRRVGEAFTRSRELVRGSGWQVFGVLLILLLATAIATAIVGGVFNLFLPEFLGSWLGSTAANALVVPFFAVAVTVMYLRLVERAAGGGEIQPD
jgi:hypothetical protein